MFLISIILIAIASYAQSQTELVLPALPYAYNALEPVLSEHLMRLHHDKHHLAYATKANAALKSIVTDEKLKDLANQPIEVILTRLQDIPEKYRATLRNNGGGFVNHKLFFAMLRKPTDTAAENIPTGALHEAIEKSFGSFDAFKEMFTTAAMNVFGSGWVWLYVDAQTKSLVLNYTANQDNPYAKKKRQLFSIDLSRI